jgi:hypothetical protein
MDVRSNKREQNGLLTLILAAAIVFPGSGYQLRILLKKGN